MVEMILESAGIPYSCPKGIYYHLSYLLYIPNHHAHLILNNSARTAVCIPENPLNHVSFGSIWWAIASIWLSCIPSSLQLGDVLSVSVDTTGLRGSEVFALDNGLALTPPMGWMTWQRYRCETDCSGPGAKRCINEDLIKEMADQMAEAWGRVLCGVLLNIYFNLSIHFDRQLG